MWPTILDAITYIVTTKSAARFRFRDVASELAVEDISAGMSVTWGNFNNDDMMDVYVSNMFSSAGNRIAYQRKFREQASSQQRQQFQRHARGNTLFEGFSQGGQNRLSVTLAKSAQVTMGRWAWGSKFYDLNNDGWEDIYVANGFITTDDTGDSVKFLLAAGRVAIAGWIDGGVSRFGCTEISECLVCAKSSDRPGQVV